MPTLHFWDDSFTSGTQGGYRLHICYVSSAKRQRNGQCSLRVKLPPATSLTTQNKRHPVKCFPKDSASELACFLFH